MVIGGNGEKYEETQSYFSHAVTPNLLLQFFDEKEKKNDEKLVEEKKTPNFSWI